MKPACANWNIWKGGEVEGTASRGTMTLFIRSFGGMKLNPTDNFAWIREKSGCDRVWFCKEFTNWPLIRAIAKHFKEVCLEVEPKNLHCTPDDVLKMARVYLKVHTDKNLKVGDFICVGPAFSDQSFEFGTGTTVTPLQYEHDIRIA